MTNIFKRNKTYYIRLSINDDLKIYFGNKREYIKSLKTHNINNAKLITKYLLSKFNYIKRAFKMFTTQEIKEYIEEFKKTNFDDIINRNTHLSINEIDNIIRVLNQEVDIYDELIEKELYDLMKLIDLNDSEKIIYGMDVDSAEKFKKSIIQIKINALNEVKKNIQNKINIENSNQINIDNNEVVTIKQAIDEWINTRVGITDNQKYMSERDVKHFLEYCDMNKIIYIQNLKHSNLIDYRNYLKKVKSKSKISTLNNALTNIITFLNHCHEKSHYINKITKDVKFTMTKKDKLKQRRKPYTNEEYKKILDNINLIKHTPKGKLTKYHNEYETIIKIGAYTGGREREICQLTKKDILKDENDIYYFNFRIEIDEEDDKELKTISSFRKVPIHSELLDDVLKYVKSVRTNNLFKIKSNYFSIDFGEFKRKLGFGEKHVFHSFRNTLQNKLKQKKVEFQIINEIAGHGSEDEDKITNDYTEVYELHILKEAIEKISYID